MAHAYWSSAFTSSAEDIWAVVRRFNGLPDWHPAIQDSAIVEGESEFTPGAIRLLTGTDGSTYREQLVALDDARRTLTYEIVDAPLPVSGYRSTLRVQAVSDTGGAFLTWQSTLDAVDGTTPEEASMVLEGAYAQAIVGLHKTFG
jgi:hypothetical protein